MRDRSNVTYPSSSPVHWGAWLFVHPLVLTAWLFPQGWEPQRKGAVRALLLCLLWLALPTTAQNQWTSMKGPYSYIWDFSTTGNSLYVASDSGIFLYDEDDQRWQPQGLINALSIEVNPEDPSILLSLRDTNFGWRDLYISTDGGTSWEWTGLGHSPDFIPIAIATSDPSRVYAGHWRSDDKGATWDTIATQFRDYGSIIVHPEYIDTLYVAGRDGVYKSHDGGVTWDTLGFIDTSGGKVIAVDPNHGDVLYVGIVGKGVFKSTDGGAQWMPINTGLTNWDFVGIAVDPNNSNHLYLATYGGGVFYSENGGEVWKPINEGLPNLDVTTLGIDSRKVYIGVGMSYGEQKGVYQRDFVTSVRIHQQNTRPDAFDLFPNYPNPFNAQTALQFQILISAFVTLKIYNAMGAEVITLVDEYLNAGYNTVNWDGKNANGQLVSSGVYLYKFKAASFIKTRKMILLR